MSHEDASRAAVETPPWSALGPLLGWALLAKLLLIGVLMWAAEAQPSDSPYLAPRAEGTSDVAYLLSRGFDSHAYQRMAREGYYDRFSRNYPPGYPLLVRGALLLTESAQTAAVIVSNLASMVAIALFFAVARRTAARALPEDVVAARVRDATLLFAVTPGVLAFGTVAYSECTQLVFALGAWWALLRAEGRTASAARATPLAGDWSASGATPLAGNSAGSDATPFAGDRSGSGATPLAGDSAGSDATPAADGRRSLPLLATASLLAAASVMMRHLGAPLVLALAVVECLRVARRRTRRAWSEALVLLWTAPLLVGYFAWKFLSHDLSGLQSDLWSMRFAPLAGPASLFPLGTSAEHVVLIYMSLPIIVLLLARLRRVDRRLVLVALLTLVTALSFTGVAAQSFTRYAWTIWPLSLGALAVGDRAVTWALAGWLALISTWCALGHVQGSAAL